LICLFIDIFLFTNVGANPALIQTHGAHTVPAGPELSPEQPSSGRSVYHIPTPERQSLMNSHRQSRWLNDELRGSSECGTAAPAVVGQREDFRHGSTAGGGCPTFVLLNNKKL
jgi:hypothetical protein